jgi:membrane protein implicated in regulation of membrane protease activity
LAGLISLALPVVGAGVALYGGYEVAQGNRVGWAWFALGVGLVVADFILDWVWAHSSWSRSDELHLNRRGAQLVGEIVVVVEPIEPQGRGKVRAADTVWAAEGVAAPVGTRVRVTGCKGTVLSVEKV